jgi:hypothetical protein
MGLLSPALSSRGGAGDGPALEVVAGGFCTKVNEGNKGFRVFCSW